LRRPKLSTRKFSVWKKKKKKKNRLTGLILVNKNLSEVLHHSITHDTEQHSHN
jgi:hypothetical protein